MNPLDLRGPEFLAFYAVLGVATLAALHFLRRGLESAAAGRVSLSDPYLIAYLREGSEEALRVATISLVDRGLLEVDRDSVVTSDSSAQRRVHRPIERTLLETFRVKRHARSALRDAGLQAATTELREALEQQGLLPGRGTKLMRWGLVLGALAVLWGTAGAKVVVALSRGRHNVLFLIVAAVALAAACVFISFPRLTRRGETLLEDLKTLFRGLERRAERLKRGAPTEEAVLLAAVYGIMALPDGKWNFAHTLLPPPEVRAADRSSAHTGSGSSCGSSSSSCGSSCGGGGCGGGCGGCGS